MQWETLSSWACRRPLRPFLLKPHGGEGPWDSPGKRFSSALHGTWHGTWQFPRATPGCYSRRGLGSPAPALFWKTLWPCDLPHLGGARGPAALALPRPLPPLGAVWRDLDGPRHGTVPVVRPPRGCEVRRKWLGFPHLLPRSTAGESKAWAWPGCAACVALRLGGGQPGGASCRG